MLKLDLEQITVTTFEPQAGAAPQSANTYSELLSCYLGCISQAASECGSCGGFQTCDHTVCDCDLPDPYPGTY